MEGADPIRTPAELDDWYARGLRSIMPAWRKTQYAGSASGDVEGFTSLGRALLEEMAKFNMILDLSHLSFNGCMEALDAYPSPIIGSHCNPITSDNTSRGIANEVIRGIGERDGVVGIMLYNRFLNSEWTYDTEPGLVTIRTVVDAIDAVVQITGSVAHVGLGSDLDGGFGAEAIPLGMDTAIDLLKIGESLAAHSYSTDDIEAIMSGNWLRILRRCLG
jgi:membrane dipeptidase